MPRGDGTGPMGMGPMTGRGAGFCAGFKTPGYMNTNSGFGLGCGRGCGFRRMFYFTGMPGSARYGNPAYASVNAPVENEKDFLSRQAKFLENRLQQIRKQLKKLNEDTE